MDISVREADAQRDLPRLNHELVAVLVPLSADESKIVSRIRSSLGAQDTPLGDINAVKPKGGKPTMNDLEQPDCVRVPFGSAAVSFDGDLRLDVLFLHRGVRLDNAGFALAKVKRRRITRVLCITVSALPIPNVLL